MNEYEVYLEQAVNYVSEFLDNKRNYADTIQTMNVTFGLDEQQETALRIVLTELDYMAEHINHDELVRFVGLNCNIVANILLKDWQKLNNETLK